MRDDPDSGVNRGNPASDALRLAVFGDVPRGRVVIVGELDLLTAPQLERLLTKLLHAGYRQLSVDASGVDFFAAAGLNVLIEASCRYQEAGGRLQLLDVPAPVQRVLTISRLDAGLNLVQPNGNHPATSPRPRTEPAKR